MRVVKATLEDWRDGSRLRGSERVDETKRTMVGGVARDGWGGRVVEGWRQRVVCFAVEPLVNLYGISIEPRLKNFY